MKKAIVIVALLSIIISYPFVGAQPTPPAVDTLGPAIFPYYTPNNITTIYSPINGGIYPNPIFLNFSVSVTAMLGQFGNVGYSLDDGNITSVNDFINQTVDYNPTDTPAWYFYNTTAFASVVLPPLSEGIHNVTVYFGWQYLGTPENTSLKRFEVSSLATSNFIVGEISTPSANPLPSLTTILVVIVVLIIVIVVGLLYKSKTAKVKEINK